MTGILTVKILFILEFWPPPNLVPDERSCIFRPHYLKKERNWQSIDAKFEFYTKKYPQIQIFRVVGGSIIMFMSLLTSSFTPRCVFDSDSPTNFRWLLRENDRDYDAQIFRIFISHHYLPPHLKWKKSMTCCSAHPEWWHGIAQTLQWLYN